MFNVIALLRWFYRKQLSSFEVCTRLRLYERATRNDNTLIEIPLLKLEVAKQSFYVAAAKNFNSLLIEIRLIKDFKTFRSLIFDHFQS